MIDLHIHTDSSDGVKNVEESLKECEALRLSTIAITDHDSVGAYKYLEKPEIRNLFSGRILPGIEFTGMLNGVPTHILGYGIDYKKAEKMVNASSYSLLSEFLSKNINSLLAKLGISARVDGDLNKILAGYWIS